MKGLPKVDVDRCTFCGVCAEACPEKLFEVEWRGIRIDEERCSGCGNCVVTCELIAYTPALSVVGGKAVVVDLEKCVRLSSGWVCTECVEACPRGLLKFVGEVRVAEDFLEKCWTALGRSCRICAEACPENAIELP